VSTFRRSVRLRTSALVWLERCAPSCGIDRSRPADERQGSRPPSPRVPPRGRSCAGRGPALSSPAVELRVKIDQLRPSRSHSSVREGTEAPIPDADGRPERSRIERMAGTLLPGCTGRRPRRRSGGVSSTTRRMTGKSLTTTGTPAAGFPTACWAAQPEVQVRVQRHTSTSPRNPVQQARWRDRAKDVDPSPNRGSLRDPRARRASSRTQEPGARTRDPARAGLTAFDAPAGTEHAVVEDDAESAAIPVARRSCTEPPIGGVNGEGNAHHDVRAAGAERRRPSRTPRTPSRARRPVAPGGPRHPKSRRIVRGRRAPVPVIEEDLVAIVAERDGWRIRGATANRPVRSCACQTSTSPAMSIATGPRRDPYGRTR